MAPTLADGGQAHIRGVSDPNAPFTLIDRRKTAVSPQSENLGSATACMPGELQVYEAAAATNGQSRSLTLAIKNRGASSCRLTGRPEIALLDQTGAPVAGIAVQQMSELQVSGSVVPPTAPSARVPAAQVSSGASPQPASQEIDIVLLPSGEANFEIGWSSGDACPLVSRFSVSLSQPGGEAGKGDTNLRGSFSINHALNVCNSAVQVTFLRLAGAA